jgi:hypothetical protein
MERPFERVHTIPDWYDGPRAGIADFDGAPHAYRSLWEDVDDRDAPERCELSPVSPEILALALEDWEIWIRWEDAFYAGDATIDTHPALPADAVRHREIAPRVERAMEIDPARRRVARADFRMKPGAVRPPRGFGRIQLEVRWTPEE